ncbi:hypothetical protein [Gracilibacillus kekensis]|uniref:Uncharacterized protein n=1 Tax=Gracilibacillus kekensis TaxID=1027249 RepID=A0A1M7P5K1_9BACI|nr:hypothetical protein [Gracilibacillus kekensis]SHN11421.1 hypothetical protein SAMN05216179_1979 [Gracilibacillus kekensis]
MDEGRKKIIIQEIHYWKDHQLLPNHYCDFLLALYTEGEVASKEKNDKKQTAYYLLFYFFDTLLILFPVLLFQITNSIVIQVIGIVLTLTAALVMTTVFKRYKALQESFAVMIFFVVFLFSSMMLLNNYVGIAWITYSWILINSLSWILFGKFRKQFFLQVAGVFILIILVIMVGFQYF